MKVLITGANGFIGKNLDAHLRERSDVEVVRFAHDDSAEKLADLVREIDFVFHLAGVNRPQRVSEFKIGNTDLTQLLCQAIVANGKSIPILYASSIQANLHNPYGESKRGAEGVLLEYARAQGSPVHIFRLPNVFGKWTRPNYNSAVATFCYNIARDLPIQINDPSAKVALVYIDDVIARFVDVMNGNITDGPFYGVEPQYSITVGDLVQQITAFRDSRHNLVTERVGEGLTRALYSTYVSYLPPEHFAYEVPKYDDPRGTFVEMLKTRDSGQFSFFTAHPGVTRGGHFHHSKTEKFLVIKGEARFRFRHIITGDYHELLTTGVLSKVVETVPGWTHDITNIGQEELIVMLWANEIFDRAKPDTIACKV